MIHECLQRSYGTSPGSWILGGEYVKFSSNHGRHSAKIRVAVESGGCNDIIGMFHPWIQIRRNIQWFMSNMSWERFELLTGNVSGSFCLLTLECHGSHPTQMQRVPACYKSWIPILSQSVRPQGQPTGRLTSLPGRRAAASRFSRPLNILISGWNG